MSSPLGAQEPPARVDLTDDVITSQAANIELGSERIGQAMTDGGEDSRPRLRGRYLIAVYAAIFTLYIAFVAPIAYSLAVRVEQIAPAEKDSILALAIGIPGVLAVIFGPLTGRWSDRTTSRFGRRRPWLLAGVIVGFIGVVVIAFTETAPTLIIGWCIAYVGYSVTGGMITAHLGDRLPELQRGRVLGITGAITQIAPLIGVVLGGALASTGGGLFIGPGILAVLGGVIFALVMRDPAVKDAKSTSTSANPFASFWFNPRRYPNLGWVWISRALIFLALSFSGLYGIYLLSSRLGLNAAEVAGFIGISGLISIVFGVGGAIGSGFLSDKLKTRKPFLIFAGIVIAIGLVGTGTTTTAAQYIISSAVTALAIGTYGAVDQALALDVLPADEDQNGRYLAIVQLGSSVPQAVGPLLAGGVLAVLGGGYAGVYFVGSALAVLGALAIIPISVGRRATLATTSVSVPDAR